MRQHRRSALCRSGAEEYLDAAAASAAAASASAFLIPGLDAQRLPREHMPRKAHLRAQGLEAGSRHRFRFGTARFCTFLKPVATCA